MARAVGYTPSPLAGLSIDPLRPTQRPFQSALQAERLWYNSSMIKALQEAIERLRQMPEDQQDLLARLMLHEIEEDEKWTRSTAANAPKLQTFVNRVLQNTPGAESESSPQ